MTKIKLSFCLFLLVFAKGLLAQVSESEPLMLQQLTATGYVKYYIQYDKTPYLTKKWSEADITVTSGEIYKDVKIKYDLFKGHIVYYNSMLKKQLVIDNEIIQKVDFVLEETNKKYELINYCTADSNKSKCEFYFNLVSDSISFWAQKVKKVNVYNDAAAGYSKLGEYYLRTKYYLVINQEIMHFPSSKRKLLKMYPVQKKGLVQFIRKNHLSFKEEDDLVRITQELNRLLALNIN